MTCGAGESLLTQHFDQQALAPLADWTSEMGGFWRGKFDDLEDLLKRMDQ